MLILLIGLNLVFCGAGVWVGYRIAKAKYEVEIEDLKSHPVEVKYVHANFVPVTVQKHIDPFSSLVASDPKAFEREIVQSLKRELCDAVLPYVRFERKDVHDAPLASHLVYKATIGVHPTLWGDPHE